MEQHKEMIITRVFNAPKELVFKAWSEADRLAKWWGPKGFKLDVAKFDFREGGEFHYSMRAPDGGEMWGLFVYGDIAASERVAFVSSFSDKDGNVAPAPFLDGKFPLKISNVVTFTEQEGKTTVTIQGGPLDATEEQRKVYTDMIGNMEQGFGGTFDQLDEYLASAL